MTLNDYQDKAMSTCMPTCDNFAYMMLNLVGEVGEFASKVAKGIRHDDFAIGANIPLGRRAGGIMEAYYYHANHFVRLDDSTATDELKKEAGDILWQLSGLCHVMGWTLEEVAQQNLDKLASRKERGVIDGNGDNR